MQKASEKKQQAEQGREMPVFEQIVHSVADHLKQEGFSSVRANVEGFSRPGRIKWEESDEGVVPDMTGEHNGCTYVFAIETRDRIEPHEVEDRWRLLSVHAKRHNGKFYLVIPEAKAGYIQSFVEKSGVNPKILKLRGLE